MSSDHFWALVAFLAIAGWTATNALLSRSLLPMANALGALHKVDATIDDRIMKVVTRVRERQNPPRVNEQPKREQQQVNPLADLFGGAPIAPVGDQPDADERLEVVG